MSFAWVHGVEGWAKIAPDQLPSKLTGKRPPAAWVHVDSLDKLAEAARWAGISEQVVERTVAQPGSDPRRPQLRRLPDGGRYLLSPTLRWDGNTRQVSTGLWAALVVDGVTLTVEEGDGALLDEVSERLRDSDHLPQDPDSQVFAAALIALVGRAGDVEIGIGEAVADAEKVVFAANGPDDPAQWIYDLKREIAEARRALVPLLAAFPDLVAEQEDNQKQNRSMRWMRRLDAALSKVDKHLDAHDSLLGDMLSVYLSRVSVRQNEDMRKISAWAAIIAVPTAIAGVYGMNFEHIPELGWQYGYPICVAVMAASCVVLFRLFKRSGWL